LELATNPLPDRTTGNEAGETAVGMVAGESEVKAAPGEETVRLMVTIVIVAGLPQVKLTVR